MNRTEELQARQASKPPAPRSARELLVAHTGANPYLGLEELERVGHERAQAEAVAYLLDQKRKSVLASICSELATVHAKEGLSETKLERLARSDLRYITHLEATADAIGNRERLNVSYWALSARLGWDERAISHLNALSRLDGR
ncbi:MAG: hypothetical protein O2992_09665 [Gemmatimonadetes bacterium]|nr:hypothetical protein [Gemmatimonadota bacterium]